MTTNFKAMGDMLGLLIDRPTLEKIGIDEQTPIVVTADAEGLHLRPIRLAFGGGGAGRPRIDGNTFRDPLKAGRMNPRFLRVEDVIRIQELQLAKDGGLAGIREPNLLESAVMQPMATFGGDYLHDDIFLMAAAYLFHLVKNHPFLDGNKRAGLVAALAFLKLNGIDVSDPDASLYDATMAVAEGRLDKAELAVMLRGLATSMG